MCKVMEEYAKECVDEVVRGNIVNAIANGIEPEVIVKIFNVPLEMILKIKEEM